MFRDEGYDVVTVGSANSALLEIERTSPDLIVTDLSMPELDGIEFIRQVRARPAMLETPIIVVSGSEDRGERLRGFREGADDFMPKPVDVDELLARVARHLRRHSLELEHQRRSVVDELTNVLNRRGLENLFARESERCSQIGASLSVLFVDLDKFKAINDSFGHMVGDMALSTVAHFLQSAFRATDRVGRLGGDEFLVVMPNASAIVAGEIATRIRAQFPLEVPVGGERTISLTFSIGIATQAPSEPFHALIARADQDMYADKGTHSTT